MSLVEQRPELATVPSDAKPTLQFWQFAKFVAVGLLNTGFGYAVFAGIFLLTASQTVAIIVANLIGMTFNYFSIGRLVFASMGGVAPRFFASYGVVLVVNLAMAEVARQYNLGGLLAQLALLPILVPLSYFLNALFVFRKAPPVEEARRV